MSAFWAKDAQIWFTSLVDTYSQRLARHPHCKENERPFLQKEVYIWNIFITQVDLTNLLTFKYIPISIYIAILLSSDI